MKLQKTAMLGAVLGTALVAPLAFANEEKKSVDPEVRQDLQAALLADDYDEFVSVAAAAGLERAAQISQEKFDLKVDKRVKRLAIREAIENGNYLEFRALVGDKRAAEINNENFSLLTNLSLARASGDEESIIEAKEALQDAGIKKIGKRGGHKMHRGEK